MAKSSSNINTPPPKTKKPTAGGPSTKGDVSPSKKQSIESQEFILRPSNSSNKSVSKAYVAVEDLRSIGSSPGDVLSLVCNDTGRSTFAIATPLISENTGYVSQSKRIPFVQLSKALRTVLDVSLGSRVTISSTKIYPSTAAMIVVGTAQGNASGLTCLRIAEVLAEVKLVFKNLELTIDEVDCKIVDIVPEGLDLQKLSLEDKKDGAQVDKPFYCASNTVVNIRQISVASSAASYSSIGGLEKQIQLLRSKIEMPLHFPELFDRFNLTPDRGFLLYGPPGTGKTLLLKAVANETEANVIKISGPSIVSKYLGETEQTLRKIFEEARDLQPSIIFIDEMDALVPKRDGDDSGEAESRVVSTLLTLMDGMGSGGRVVVIGATNRPNSIDPALRRPGRFGQEVEIPIPDVEGRLAILHILFDRTPNKLSPLFLSEIAAKAHGYVGADLFAVCRDAAMLAIQRGMEAQLNQESMFIEQQDVERAFIDIRPSAMREIFLETPHVLWSDVGGQEVAKQRLHEIVNMPLEHPDAFKRLGVQVPKGVLLYGPPGCSKTLIAKALATESGLNFLAVKGPELFNKYVGESEKALREVFRRARAASPSIIFFDEIDAISESRGESGAGGDRVLTTLLNEMDGIETLNGVIILAATNIPDKIDAALMRPGRLDRLVYISPPDLAARRKIFEIQQQRMAFDPTVDLDHLARLTEGCSGAEVVSLCQEAGLAAIQEDIDSVEITGKHFEKVMKNIKKAITKDMIDYYEKFASEGSVA